MLPIDQTFRTLQPLPGNQTKVRSLSQITDEPCDRLSVSPFENPIDYFRLPTRPANASPPTDFERPHAAHFASVTEAAGEHAPLPPDDPVLFSGDVCNYRCSEARRPRHTT